MTLRLVTDAGGATDGLAELAAAAAAGDADASERLADAAWPRLNRIALALGVPPDDAPDLVQDVLLSAWRNLDRFDPARGSFVGWLVPGLRGRAQNRLRAGGRRVRFLEKLRIVAPRQHRGERNAVDARLTLGKLLNVLTPRQREVVALYEIEGMSSKETARVLEISEAGVRSVARDARRRLRDAARRLETEKGETS